METELSHEMPPSAEQNLHDERDPSDDDMDDSEPDVIPLDDHEVMTEVPTVEALPDRKELVATVVEMVKNKELSIRRASDEYGIPRTTLCCKVNGKRLNDKPGRTTFLSSSEEEEVARWCLRMQDLGKSVTKNQLVDQVKYILDSSGRKSPFRDNRPGRKWYRLFMKRNPHLHLGSRKTMIKKREEAAERAMVPIDVATLVTDFRPATPECAANEHLNNLPQLLKDGGAFNISSNVERIFAIEELSFHVDRNTGAVGSCRTSLRPSPLKHQITVLTCFSAKGHFCSPIIAFPDSWFSYDPLDGFPNAFLGTSRNGFVDADTFYCWLKNVFIPNIELLNLTTPVVLLLTRCSHLISEHVLDLCKEFAIIVQCDTQRRKDVVPTTQAIFLMAVQEAWKMAAVQYAMDNPGEEATKEVFARLFKPVWCQVAAIGVATTGVLKLFSKLLNQDSGRAVKVKDMLHIQQRVS